MPRRPTPFRQSDIARAVKGAMAAGGTVESVQVDADGRIVVTLTKAGAATPSTDFDVWRAKRARST